MESQRNHLDDCWNHIGVKGDRSCEQLETVIHCRNCSVYSAAGRSLLEREVPIDYVNEWTTALAATEITTLVEQTSEVLSAIVFRLGNEQFALPVGVLHEVAHPGMIHTLPHRSNDLFLGLVNIRGEILLCASLSRLLEVETSMNSRVNLRRMLVVGADDRKWVFVVDEVQRICRFHPHEVKAVPVVVSQANEAYTQGIIDWKSQKVNYLDADLLFYTLERKIL